MFGISQQAISTPRGKLLSFSRNFPFRKVIVLAFVENSSAFLVVNVFVQTLDTERKQIRWDVWDIWLSGMVRAVLRVDIACCLKENLSQVEEKQKRREDYSRNIRSQVLTITITFHTLLVKKDISVTTDKLFRIIIKTVDYTLNKSRISKWNILERTITVLI